MTSTPSFIGIYEDLVFKHVFGTTSFALDFIKSYLEFMGIDCDIEILNLNRQFFIQGNSIVSKDYYVDLLSTLSNGTIINLEMYNNFGKIECNKTMSYATKIYSDQVLKKTGYRNLKKVLSLNIVRGNFKRNNPKLVNSYELNNLVTLKKLMDNGIEIILIRLDKLNKIKYSKEEKRFITWLRVINASSYEELESYAKGDELFMQVMDNVRMYVENPVVEKLYEVEDWKLEAAEERGREDGISIGHSKGRVEGRAEGKKDQAIQTAKTMFARDYSLEEVSIITNLSKEELLKLKK